MAKYEMPLNTSPRDGAPIVPLDVGDVVIAPVAGTDKSRRFTIVQHIDPPPFDAGAVYWTDTVWRQKTLKALVVFTNHRELNMSDIVTFAKNNGGRFHAIFDDPPQECMLMVLRSKWDFPEEEQERRLDALNEALMPIPPTSLFAFRLRQEHDRIMDTLMTSTRMLTDSFLNSPGEWNPSKNPPLSVSKSQRPSLQKSSPQRPSLQKSFKAPSLQKSFKAPPSLQKAPPSLQRPSSLRIAALERDMAELRRLAEERIDRLTAELAQCQR